MRVLITGDAGFLGTALKAELCSVGHETIGYDIESSRYQDVLDIDSLSSTIRGHKPSVVVHLAAEVGKLNCENNPSRATEVNVVGTMNVAKACAEHGARLVYCSTSEVYGDHGSHEVTEASETIGDGYAASGMYAITKHVGETVALTYAPGGLQIIRPTMPYGPGVPPGPGRRALDNLIWQALTGQPMIVHRGAARSWCWIGDLARAIRLVIESEIDGVFNVGRDDDMVEMHDLAIRIRDLIQEGGYVGSTPVVREIDTPNRQTAVKNISCAKLRGLGWSPTVSLDQGLPRMVEWIRSWLARQA